MGRPIKNGMDYHPMDVNWYNDVKVRKLKNAMGGGALCVLMVLYSKIHAAGYYLDWNDDELFYLSEDAGFDEQYTREVVDQCLKVGLLCKQLFEEYAILTSHRIQLNYVEAKKKSKNKIDERFSLINDIYSGKTAVNSEETTVFDGKTAVNSKKAEISTQNKIKENKRKENISSPSPPPCQEGGQTGREELKYYPTKEALASLEELIFSVIHDSDQITAEELLRLSCNMADGSIGKQTIDWWAEQSGHRLHDFNLKQVVASLREDEKMGELEDYVIPYPHYETLLEMMRKLNSWDYREACSLIRGPNDKEAFNVCRDCMAEIIKGGINSPGAFLLKRLREMRREEPVLKELSLE